MALERPAPTASMIDVLDRVLDKGIVIDWWARMSLAGINLMAFEAKMLVASIETYLDHPGGGAGVIGEPVYSSPEPVRIAPAARVTKPAKGHAARRQHAPT